jgi:hypothetical protein|nr:MAG TPA: Head Tail Connector Protein [Caudoviricetes sp.]DAT09104.1 MAG TPA: Head Tail Connector Protein [Caudoviricetes sp.]
MYVSYSYYRNEYGGIMPEERFTTCSRRAETYIRYLTCFNGNVFAVESESIKQAVCAAADVYYEADEAVQKEVKSENNDGWSASYVTEQKDGQTREELIKKKAYEAVYMYLLPSGWLNRKVRCHNDHECRHNGL